MKVRVKVHPSSSQEKIVQVDKASYEIWLKEKSIDGKANMKLLKLLKKYFKRDVELVSGKTSRKKIVELN